MVKLFEAREQIMHEQVQSIDLVMNALNIEQAMSSHRCLMNKCWANGKKWEMLDAECLVNKSWANSGWMLYIK